MTPATAKASENLLPDELVNPKYLVVTDPFGVLNAVPDDPQGKNRAMFDALNERYKKSTLRYRYRPFDDIEAAHAFIKENKNVDPEYKTAEQLAKEKTAMQDENLQLRKKLEAHEADNAEREAEALRQQKENEDLRKQLAALQQAKSNQASVLPLANNTGNTPAANATGAGTDNTPAASNTGTDATNANTADKGKDTANKNKDNTKPAANTTDNGNGNGPVDPSKTSQHTPASGADSKHTINQ